MSYTIFYEKTFIKTSNDKYLPMVISGCNNLYEWNNKKRVRNWNCLVLDNYLYTSEEIVKYIEDWRESDRKHYEDDKEFGDIPYAGARLSTKSDTTFKDLIAFVKHGINRAIDFNEFIALGYSVIFKSYEGDFYKTPKTEKELFEIVNEAIQHEKPIYVELSLSEENVKFLRKKIYPKKPSQYKKVLKTYPHYFVIQHNDNGYYTVKNRKWSYSYCYDIYFAKKFKTELQAEKYNKFSNFKVVKIEKPWEFEVRVKKLNYV